MHRNPTTNSFRAMMDFHTETGSAATICAREFTMQVPYGVLNTEGTTLVSMEEKSVHKHLVNAGIYALSPLVFEHFRDYEPLDMPDLIDRVKAAGHRVSVLPVREYWMDIGRIEDWLAGNPASSPKRYKKLAGTECLI